MHLRFGFEKSLQAAGVLLALEAGRMSYLRLLKLLYIADRELLATVAASITGDRVYAMKHGPVLSHVYDLIKGVSSQSSNWNQFIATAGYAVQLKSDPGRDELSRDEVAKLTEVSDRYRNQDRWEISDLTHDFPEWRDHFSEDARASVIPWEDILKVQGKDAMVAAVREREDVLRSFDAIFGAEP